MTKENPEMDAAAEEAQKDFEDNVIAENGNFRDVANWIKRWKDQAGYKRLGLILLKIAD